MTEQLTLAELAEQSGTPARTIRFYISRGLLDGPVKGGRAAAYTPAQLKRLQKIKALQAQGHMLSEIAALLGAGKTRTVQPSAWWQYKLTEEVMVWTRSDLSPWRMRQVRAAVEEMMNRIANEEDE